MAKGTADLVNQRRGMSSADPAKCRKALEASKGDVDKALRALIASGDVTAEALDPELTTNEHYALAELKKKQDQAAGLATSISSLLGAAAARKVGGELEELGRQLAGRLRLDDEALSEGADARRRALEARKPKGGRKSDAGGTEDAASLLAKMSSMPAARCEAALRAAKGDVHAALRSRIASGEVLRGDLDPDLATDEQYGLCEIKRLLDFQSKMPPRMRRLGGITAATLKGYRDQLSGKTPVLKHFLRLGQFARDNALGARAPVGRRSARASSGCPRSPR